MNQLFDSIVNDPTVAAVGLALAAGAAGLWLAAAWWTYADMARRSTFEVARFAAVGWILLSTPLLLPLSLATYLLARPQRTSAERKAERLFVALAPSLGDGHCLACGSAVDPEWRRCPACRSWLATGCEACGRFSAVDLDVCPWCAEDKMPDVPRPATAQPDRSPTEQPAAPVPVMAAGASSDAPVDGLAGGMSPVPQAAAGEVAVMQAAAAAAVAPGAAALFVPDPDTASETWVPEPASGDARPAAAYTIHRIGSLRAGNRGARDPQRVRDAERIAGSSGVELG
ncbi:MAG TPA: zinc ribbon domain-containing protein [Candidatus Limnocylindrales bacterium]